MVDPQLVHKALQGHPIALRAILEAIGPAVQVSVADTLRRRIPAAAYSRARHEVEDLTQEVLLALFANDGKRLRTWDPERGLSLPGYVKLVARHLVLSFLRKRERRVWEDEPVNDVEPDAQHPGASPERIAEQKELSGAVLAAVEAELTLEGRKMFQLLIVEGRSVDEVCQATKMTSNAVHIWRSRLAQRADEATRRILQGDLS